MLRAGAQRNLLLTRPAIAIGAGAPLPAALSGNLGRWDGYSGIVADATNGGFKWNPESGSSVLQSVSGTGPDYSATGLSGRPAMLLSTGKSLVAAPTISLAASGFYFAIVVNMPAPGTYGHFIGNTSNGPFGLRANTDGSVDMIRNNQAIVATAAAGSMPFDVPVLLFYTYNNGVTIKHVLRTNKVLRAVANDTVGAAYGTAANSILIGRQVAASSASSDLNAAVSFIDFGTSAPTGSTLTDYEAAIYQRYVA